MTSSPHALLDALVVMFERRDGLSLWKTRFRSVLDVSLGLRQRGLVNLHLGETEQTRTPYKGKCAPVSLLCLAWTGAIDFAKVPKCQTGGCIKMAQISDDVG
jgi:hypothetical protein